MNWDIPLIKISEVPVPVRKNGDEEFNTLTITVLIPLVTPFPAVSVGTEILKLPLEEDVKFSINISSGSSRKNTSRNSS